MMTIETLNSIYEVDHQHGRFRRVEGNDAPTPNFEEDGMWHAGKVIEMGNGLQYLFTFDDRTKGLTTSSQVLRVSYS